MKAIVQNRFGSPDDLILSDIVMPEATDDKLLIRVHAASVGAWVWRMLYPDPLIMRIAGAGLVRPKHPVPGGDMAGIVEAVGPQVTQFAPGDEVYGECHGTFAEYTIATQDEVAPKPRNLSFEEAAAVPIAGSTALLGLRDHGKVVAGQRVLIIGAAGGVGTFAVQVAKVLGAEVTGVCSTASKDLVRSLGADHVIDYTRRDFTVTSEHYDVIFQLAGEHRSSTLRRLLSPTGILVLSSGEGGSFIGPLGRFLWALISSPFIDQTLTTFVAKADKATLVSLTKMLEAGEIHPVVERTFALADTAAAIRHVEEGHARGKTIITI